MKKKQTPKMPNFSDLILHPKTYRDLGPFGIITLIDDMLKRAVLYLKKAGKKEAEMRELFIRYGQCSRAMNSELRRIIKEKSEVPKDFNTEISKEPLSMEQMKQAAVKETLGFDDDLFRWKLAYAYWWNRTQFLETFQKSFLGGMTDRKNINIGANRIITWMRLKPAEIKARAEKESAFSDLIERLAKKTELTEVEIQEVFDGKEVTKNYD